MIRGRHKIDGLNVAYVVRVGLDMLLLMLLNDIKRSPHLHSRMIVCIYPCVQNPLRGVPAY